MEFLEKLKRVKMKDVIAIFIFILAVPIAIIYRKRRKNLWLICERENEARDNGYWLYRYIRENYLSEDVVYAIKKDSKDYKKIERLGEVVEYGSYQHWVYYLTATKNISSQKGGKPNAAVCYFLEVYGFIKNTRIYLKHGIIKDNMEWMHYKNTKIKLLICGAKNEYEYVKKVYGYPNENIKYLGLARFDGLHNYEIKKEQILIMPTWRNWLRDLSKEEFLKSSYYIEWKKVLDSEILQKEIEKNNKKIVFYLHPNFQKYSDILKSSSKNIIIATDNDYDMQELLKESAFLVTDYSSIFMDFAYMRKPMIYYQFDEKIYREKQYQEGYFDYRRDGFGEVCSNTGELLSNLIKYIKRDFKQKNIFLEREKNFFELYDTKNCERIYRAIKEL